ncbi:hypothetical protein KUCAC02_021520 [Chaenocephalus aceratus]|uniref:Uncharacterized protein n=1 Tax=Chaenocephalus aceratus TaxID=36190 RepID=A0ACB9XFT0_CHAAC|nr:hypothetical protein KUCAC02_021520 [Chaenocephalus aceratus]
MIWTERLFKLRTDKRERELLCSVLQRPSPQGGVSGRLAMTDLALAFKKMLKKCNVGKREEKWPPIEEEMLKILARNDKKDDERICTEHSFTDFRASSRS